MRWTWACGCAWLSLTSIDRKKRNLPGHGGQEGRGQGSGVRARLPHGLSGQLGVPGALLLPALPQARPAATARPAGRRRSSLISHVSAILPPLGIVERLAQLSHLRCTPAAAASPTNNTDATLLARNDLNYLVIIAGLLRIGTSGSGDIKGAAYICRVRGPGDGLITTPFVFLRHPL